MTSTSNSYHSSSTPAVWVYDVFLSFNGKDTRKSFTDHLYTALTRAPIRTFRDTEEIPIGEPIPQALQEAIDHSNIFIPIFSKNYASSRWCLIELTQMMKCKKSKGRLVFPIFYDVTPSDVRHQKGSFEKAFSKHEKEEKKTVRGWKEALSEVATLKGWEKDKFANGHEAKLVDEVVSRVRAVLSMNNHVPWDKVDSRKIPWDKVDRGKVDWKKVDWDKVDWNNEFDWDKVLQEVDWDKVRWDKVDWGNVFQKP